MTIEKQLLKWFLIQK